MSGTRNPLSYDGIQPIANMGAIPGKVRLDKVTVDIRMADSHDPDTMISCVPGGQQPENHAILWGDPVFGLKCIRDGGAADGEPNELVTASIAGENMDKYGGNLDAFEEEHYFAGFAVDNVYLVDPNTGQQGTNLAQGIATVRVGTQSTRNNGPYEFFPGNRIAYRCPRTVRTNQGGGLVMADSGNTLVKRARVGEPNTRPRFELVPFDYTDFTTQIAGAYSMLQHKRSENNAGIADIPFHEFEQRNERTNVHVLSGRMEAAGGRKFGDFGFVLAVIETLVTRGMLSITVAGGNNPRGLAVAMGLWSTEPSDVILEAYRNAYFQDLPLSDPAVESARNDFVRAYLAGIGSPANVVARDNSRDKNTDVNYAKLRLQLSKFKDGALVSDLYAKMSKIIGTALNNAEPTQTLHVMAGHTPV